MDKQLVSKNFTDIEFKKEVAGNTSDDVQHYWHRRVCKRFPENAITAVGTFHAGLSSL